MQRPKHHGDAAILIVALLSLLPVLYFLSLGPACVLGEKQFIDEATLLSVYYPLAYLAEQDSVAATVIDWYVELWIGWFE